MKNQCKKLRNDIIKSAAKKKLNPYKNPFQPKDLNLNAGNYGSFSDHCKKGATKSSKWDGCGLLKCTDKHRPFKYILNRRFKYILIK